MLELIARNSQTGEVALNAARRYVERHEWGQARLLLEAALEKGFLSEPQQARAMLRDVCKRMDIFNGVE